MPRPPARLRRSVHALTGLAALATLGIVACSDDVTDNPPSEPTLIQDDENVVPGEENQPVNPPDGSQVTPTVLNPPPGGDPNQDQGSGEG